MKIDGNSLTLESLSKIVLYGEKVELSSEARDRVTRSRKVVDTAAQSDKKVYAINTGFGILSNVRISRENLLQLQENIIRSHCCSVGEPHTEMESRAILLLRANTLAKGYSGASPELVEHLIAMLNKRVHPVIPTKGSVGASGDLSPLAHIAAVVIGEGEAFYEGKRMDGATALNKAGLKPYQVREKEGLNLINGTQQMTGHGALVLLEAKALIDIAEAATTCTLEGVLGSSGPFTDWVQKTRAFDGQARSAKILSGMMTNSEIAHSHEDCDRVQDAYSLRCAPQVHGAIRDLFSHVERTLVTEFNAATDNPLINPDTGQTLSNGNFHGQPVAFALDILGMGLSEIGSISERRLVKLIDPHFSGLPSFLVVNEGLNSGFMAAQYTAAALVSENKGLCHPSSTDSLPTCNEKEDHVSMGPYAARKAKTILQNSQVIVAIELLASCQALDFRKPLRPGRGPEITYNEIRKRVPPLDRDRYLHKDIDAVTDMIRSGHLHQVLKEKELFA